MSANWLYINSPGYRRFIEVSRSNRVLFWGVAAGVLGVSVVAANATMKLTNPDLDEQAKKDHEAVIAKLPMQAQASARQNRAILKAIIQEATSGTDSERYTAMLDGKIHGTTHGTSMPPPLKDDDKR